MKQSALEKAIKNEQDIIANLEECLRDRKNRLFELKKSCQHVTGEQTSALKATGAHTLKCTICGKASWSGGIVQELEPKKEDKSW